MKKIIKLYLPIILIAIFFSGCVKNEEIKDNRINITTTYFPHYSLAKEIAGEYCNVNMLLPLGCESHSYEPTPKDIINIQNADIFICTGGVSDEWVDKILNGIDISNLKVIKLLDICNPLPEDDEELIPNDLHNHNKHKIDEHVWTSPKNAIKIADEIVNVLCEIDEENADNYRKNHKNLIDELFKMDSEIKKTVSVSDNKTLIFADRFPFLYLTQEYGLNYYSAYSGCAEETEPSIQTVRDLIDKVKVENIGYVIKLETSNGKLAQTISKETGAKILMLHSFHNVTKEEFENGISYLDIMRNNIIVLKEALN